MSYILVIPSSFVLIIALLLLIIPVVLSLLCNWLSNKNSSSKISRIVNKFVIRPIPLDSLHKELSDTSDLSEMKNSLKKQLSYRFFLIYGAIVLFLIGNLIGEFYFILTDISIPMTQGSTGDTRTWASIVFNSPFSGGWMGSLPWYGNMPLPPMNLDTYHETWSWVLFTSTITDNPAFLDSTVWLILLGTIFSGLLFLSPLFLGSIRKSFIPSMFFFSTGMLITMKGIFSCFSQAFKLEFASGSITYGIHTVTRNNFQNVTDLLMSFLFPLLLAILLFFVFFALLGHKIWNHHYPNHQSSHYWFLMFISISFWGSLFILLV
ncbi:MAG: hypothetical protein ACXAC6_10130 [Candidatus Hodarchaeales archaeon]|jgi:hypothetical protein